MGQGARRGRFRSGCRVDVRRILLATAIFSGLVLPAAGHGFHNAAMATRSLDEWLADVRRGIPNLDLGAGGTAEMRSGRDLDALRSEAAQAGTPRPPARPTRRGSLDIRYSPQQQALLARKGNDCLEILAYMDPQNIYPSEFPNFQLSKIPEYQQAAKQLLKAMGPDGTRLVAGKIRQELMQSVPSASDMTIRAGYHDDLLDVLTAGVLDGHMSSQELQDLKDSTQGVKDPTQQALADRVRRAISPDEMDLASLAEWAANFSGDARLKTEISQALRKRLAEASILELLRAREAIADRAVCRQVESELSGRTPTYAELKDQVKDIWQLTGSADRQVATAARSHLAVAFQRAPIAHCLYWLGEDDRQFTALIWKQVDDRIARADAARREDYGKTAVEVLGDKEFNLESRKAAIDLLDRLKDRGTAKGVADELLGLPRELWPAAGRLLRNLTGQNLGPQEGDEISEVLDSAKKWQAWLRDNGG